MWYFRGCVSHTQNHHKLLSSEAGTCLSAQCSGYMVNAHTAMAAVSVLKIRAIATCFYYRFML